MISPLDILLFSAHKVSVFPSLDALIIKGFFYNNRTEKKKHIDHVALKLNKANAMLYKIRDFVSQNLLNTIYYALFESHLNYACTVWGQNIHSTNRLFILQKKALRTLHCKQRDFHLDKFHFHQTS